MTDIVAQLNEYAGTRSDGFAKLAVDAAAEIERLRRLPPKGDALQVSDLQQMIDNRDYLVAEYASHVATLAAEKRAAEWFIVRAGLWVDFFDWKRSQPAGGFERADFEPSRWDDKHQRLTMTVEPEGENHG